MKNTEMPMVRIYQEDGTYIDRKMNDAELAQAEIDTANNQAKLKKMEDRAEAKSALLARLGITEEEARLLLS